MRPLSASRVAAACLLLLVLPPMAALAQDQRAVLELVVNGVRKGDALVLLRGSDAFVPVSRLAEAGLRDFGGMRLQTGSDEAVSLASLAPRVTFAVDERELTLSMTADPALLGATTADFGSGAPAGMVFRSDSSGFVNYALTWSDDATPDIFAESGARAGGALFYNTLSVAGGTTLRGVTNVTVDDRRRVRRWTFGDGFAQTGALGGDAWVAGISVAREFGIAPYFVRHPSLSLSTPIAVPSTVEVHVNGRLVSQQKVDPGRLDMRNLPLTVGRNDARVVVRDAFGASREISTSYYLTSSVLAPGVHDYQYSLGFNRQSVGAASWDYRSPVALARHRAGVTDALTLGGRLEAGAGLVSLGPSVNLRLPFGEFEGGAAMSAGREGTGGAALSAYTLAGSVVSAGVSALFATGSYATLNALPPASRPRIEASAFASVSPGSRLSVTAQHTRATLHGGAGRMRSALLATTQFARDAQITVSAAATRDETGRGHEVFAGVTLLFGRASASVAAARGPAGASLVVDAQEPLPVGTGYGFNVRAETGALDTFSGAARFQNRHGRYEVRRDVFGGQGVTTASITGAVVAIGGGVYTSRPVQDSFALLRVPGVSGVRAFASHQQVGRTNDNGDLLVPELQAYYGNILNIADSDIPLAYSIDEVSMTLAPPHRGGALAVFSVQMIRRITGTVRFVSGGEQRIPEYGDMTVVLEGEPIVSPIGSTGGFYFENLPPGRHRATVEDARARCEVTLDVPAATEPVVDLGMLQCAPGAER
jgi:outer membrane usher protein